VADLVRNGVKLAKEKAIPFIKQKLGGVKHRIKNFLQDKWNKLKEKLGIKKPEQPTGKTGEPKGKPVPEDLKNLVSDEAQLQRLLGKTDDAEQLKRLLSAVGNDATKLETLLNKVGEAKKLENLLGKVPNVAQLEQLLNLTDDAAQLERFLTHIDNPVELQRLINHAGLGTAPDAFRLDRVLDKMGSGKKNIADVEAALDAQKKIDNKILFGEQKGTTPGTADFRTIRGGHSPRILTDPNYQILSQTNNPDGTIVAKFQKLVSPGPPQVWSKTKTSTLAPSGWTDNDMLRAGDQVAKTPPVLPPRTSDGATLHRDTINGVQWEVIKDASGNVTSSYPTGGTPSTSF
jgi:hypothetical protein